MNCGQSAILPVRVTYVHLLDRARRLGEVELPTLGAAVVSYGSTFA
jgi:hypothetical protein